MNRQKGNRQQTCQRDAIIELLYHEFWDGNHKRMGQFNNVPPCRITFETRSSPQENQRLEVSQVFFEAAIEGIQTQVHNTCVESVFNLDENGISEWEDRVERKAIVPSAMGEQKMLHGIHRGLKHISVVTCISTGGDHTIPFLFFSSDRYCCWEAENRRISNRH
jgi:hypothetical protein